MKRYYFYYYGINEPDESYTVDAEDINEAIDKVHELSGTDDSTCFVISEVLYAMTPQEKEVFSCAVQNLKLMPYEECKLMSETLGNILANLVVIYK
jgi:hypothetical protein